MSEQTLVLVKPDAVQRGLIGEIIGRMERKGLRVLALKMMRMDDALARRHYSEHVEKPFFKGLAEFITSGPLVAMVLAGPNAVANVRGMMGATDPAKSAPGTIRGDLGLTIGMNLIHGSDSPESALKEIEIFFEPRDVLEYSRDVDRWILEGDGK
ncbi:MAG TPA: nucleoside-diphosphate kinase [Candidatus Dormibacteraeota bacterium]|nr:nucleoside-diphosphate kinase [Candidatus Dormibacteraeota bacterium]